MTTAIPLATLEHQRDVLRERIDRAIGRVLDHGQYILGPEVAAFEAALGDYTNAPHVVSCANGTDALTLVLMAAGVGPGDLVFTPSFSFVATAEATAQLGAIPYFVDVEADSFNIDPNSLARAIEDARDGRHGTPKMVVAVDLFGQPADYGAIGARVRSQGQKQ